VAYLKAIQYTEPMKRVSKVPQMATRANGAYEAAETRNPPTIPLFFRQPFTIPSRSRGKRKPTDHTDNSRSYFTCLRGNDSP